jgi:peptidoglycan/xylan/chitin deacetylase (PgdA/CDA1 family)
MAASLLLVAISALAFAAAITDGFSSAAKRRPPHPLEATLARPPVTNERTAHVQRLRPLRIAPAHSGTARVIVHGPPRREIALTFDDGFCASCAARIIHTLAKTGAHATIFPNGRYTHSWDPLAPTIRRLVALGQLTIGNHTFLHYSPLEESGPAFAADLTNNERWIERMFHVSSRPFFRPPYGAYDAETVAIAGELGYTKVITWSGTVADSTPQSIAYILAAIRYWAKPGAIILMHANYPATSFALPQILATLHARRLRPVTLGELLGS